MATAFSFWRDRQGSVAISFAVSAIPLLGMMGAAIDYGSATRSRAVLQQAVDAAALAAVMARVPSQAEREGITKGAFQTTLRGGLSAVPALDLVTAKRASISTSGSIKTSFLQVLQVPSIEFDAQAAAERVFQGPPPCVLALNPTVSQGILIAGAAEYTAQGCTLHSNSNSGASLQIDNNAKVQAAGYCAVGQANVPGALAGKARSYCEPIEDPFRNLQAPPIGSCLSTNREVAPKDTAALKPGHYCGGLTIKGTATLSPGVYVISGRLTITAQSVVDGAGVTFYLTGANAGFTIDAGGSFDLSAPASGPYGGILFFQNKLSNAGTTNSFVGGSSSKIMGSIYTPTQKVLIAGNSGLNQDVPFLPIIADQVEIKGNIKASSNLASVTLPYPLPKTESGARLVE